MRNKKMIGISAISLVLFLPFFNWIKVVNLLRLFSRIGVTKEMAKDLLTGYNLYNLLNFVRYANQGVLGLFAMVLLILCFAVIYFNAAFIIRSFIGGKEGKENLAYLAAGKCAFLFSFLTAVAAIAFVIFSNLRFKMIGFVPGVATFIQLAVGLAAYIYIKILEKKEREKYKEHGLLGELKKNWVLFVMLIPTFIYFLINNYLPMLGVYFAFTSFNFRDGLWSSPFIGFKNFDFLIKADLFRLTRNTILYNIVFIGIGNVLQIVFAILVSRVTLKWFKKASQTLMFMPYFVSFVILKVIVYNVFEYQYGLINNIMTGMGASALIFTTPPLTGPSS